MKTRADFLADIPLEVARAAHAGTSFTPEKRGEQEREGYATTLMADWEAMAVYADTPEKLAALEEAFAEYREGYRERMRALLVTKSRAVSTMIAGPSNFPVRRQQKIRAVEDKRLTEVLEFRDRMLTKMRYAARPELRPIMTGDNNAAERLRAKLEELEKAQERGKKINAVIRKHAKAGNDAQVAALVEMGLDKAEAYVFLTPDFAGRVGEADYVMKNRNAEIRRVKARLAEVERLKAAPVVEKETAGGIRVEDNPGENRIRLFFPGKPDADVRTELKRHGFRWTPSLGCWQAYRNGNSMAHARKVAGEGDPLVAMAGPGPSIQKPETLYMAVLDCPPPPLVTPLTPPEKIPVTREEKLAAVWRHTHRDYKGKDEKGNKQILTLRTGGTHCVNLTDLTDAEIEEKLPSRLRGGANA